MLMMLLQLAIDLVIYVLVLMSLFRNTTTVIGAPSKQKWRRFYISSLIFVLSNIIILFTGFLQLLQLDYVIFDILGDGVEYINTIALNLYLLIVKSNRDLWREFLVKKSKQKSLNTLQL